MSEWIDIILSDKIGLKHGYQFRDYDFTDTGIPVVKIGNVTDKGLDLENNISFISSERENEFQSVIIHESDILMSLTGNIGRVVEVKKLGKSVVQNYRVGNFYPLDNDVYKPFIKWILTYDAVLKQITSYSNQSAQANFGKQDLDKLKFKLPTKIEQRKIARILTTVDTVIEKTEAAIAKYKAIKVGMMRDLFTRGIDVNTGKLRPGFEEAPELYKESALGWIPREWEVVRVCESCVDIVDGDRGSNYPHEHDFYEHGYCLFLNAGNVTLNGFNFDNRMFITKEKDNALGSGKLERNDVIITTRGTVGNIAFYTENIYYNNIRINSGMLILRNRDPKLLSDFLYFSFKNYLFELDFTRVVSGSAQPQLPMKDLKNFRLIKPDGLEQNRIIDICNGFDDILNREIESLNKARQLKSALMADLLTGKVRVKYEEDAVEAV